MIQGLGGYSYEDRLKPLDLPSLVYRRYRGDAIEAYKCLRGKQIRQCKLAAPFNRNKDQGSWIQAIETTVQRPTEIKFFQHANCELVEQFARRRGLGTVFKHIQKSA